MRNSCIDYLEIVVPTIVVVRCPLPFVGCAEVTP